MYPPLGAPEVEEQDTDDIDGQNIDIDKEMEDDNVEARVLGLSERDQCWQPHYNPQSTVTAQMRIKIE